MKTAKGAKAFILSVGTGMQKKPSLPARSRAWRYAYAFKKKAKFTIHIVEMFIKLNKERVKVKGTDVTRAMSICRLP